MFFIVLHHGYSLPGWTGSRFIFDFAKERNIFQTICFEPKSRHLKSVAWICPFSTRAVNTSGAIASFTNGAGRKKERNVFMTRPGIYCFDLNDNRSYLKVKCFSSPRLLIPIRLTLNMPRITFSLKARHNPNLPTFQTEWMIRLSCVKYGQRLNPISFWP